MITHKELLIKIQDLIGDVEERDSFICINVKIKKISLNKIYLLRLFLNNFEDTNFIVIRNVPYCLMPDALEHLVYKENLETSYSYDWKCQKCACYNECPGWPKEIMLKRDIAKEIKNIPREIVLEITDKCNLSCLVCQFKKNSSFSFLSYSKIKRVLDECKSLDIKAVRFTGGEPLFHPQIKDILLLAKKMGFYILLNSNGTFLNKKILKILEATVDNILISLQGYNQNSDERLTGISIDFDKKINNVKKISISKISTVRIGTVISKTLLKNMDKYYDLLEEIKISRWELFRPIKEAPDKEYDIAKDDILFIMKKIYGFKERGIMTRIANPIPFCITKDIVLSLNTLLGAQADDGHSRIIFDVRGYLKPSYFIDFNLGATVEEAWNHEFLKRIRALKYLPPRCRKCGFSKWCKGGSRALAKSSSGSYLSADPLLDVS